MEHGTIEHKIHFLATEVMGWTNMPLRLTHNMWYNSEERFICSDFNPFTDIAQAMKLLDKYPHHVLVRNKKEFTCSLLLRKKQIEKKFYNYRKAICEAVLEASGYYD